MNQLYFEGKYVDLYAEDYVYLQENAHEEYLKIIDMMILDGISSYIVSKFILRISTTDNTTLLIDQEGDTGVILTKSGLMLESDSNTDNIALSDYTYGVNNYVYCKCTQVLASYDMKTGTIVEERKALDLITQTLVYNRKIDKIEIVVYTQSEYEALTQEEKDQLVFLGSTIAQGLGQPLVIVDRTEVDYISARINDYIITFDMFDPDIMFPQKMVSPTSTGSIDDHYYEVPSPINIENDLNYIRTMLRDIKGSNNWDDTDFIIRGTIPEINTLWKSGVFIGYDDEFESTLSSTGFILSKSGSGLLYDNIKNINSSTGLYLVDNTEYTVGDWITNDGELHYIGTIPSSFYLAYTSTGNATLTDLRIIRVIGEVVSEFQRAADPSNPIPGDDYYYDTSTGMIVSLHTGIMQTAYVTCQYKYKIPKISTVRLTAYGLDIVEGSESFYPEPWTISSTGILSIGEVTQPGFPYLPELLEVPITSQRNELREIREILSTDIATYTSTGVFRDFPEYAVHRLSVKYYDQNVSSAWTTNGSWNLNTARNDLSGCGIQSAALSFGGYTGVASSVTEKFNGSIWTTNSGWNLNTGRYSLAGCGTQSSALSFGGKTGSVSAVTEKFDGSTWTTNAAWNLNTARQGLAGCGTQSAALSFGGYTGAASLVTEKFDGTTWATSSSWNLDTARFYLAGCGSQSSALSFGGIDLTFIDFSTTEKFNGSSWSTSGSWNLNIARRLLAGCGTQSSALSFGGSAGSPSAVTEKFNGSSWTNSGNLNTARQAPAGSGIQSSALSFGGFSGGLLAVTEKFNDTITSTGIVVDKGIYWDLSTKENYDNVFSLIGEGELHTIIHTQEDDELWIETFTGTTEDIELKIEYTTSTGGFDNTIYYTIPQTTGLEYKPVVKLLHKGFDKGYHKVNLSINSNINENWTVSGNLNTARAGLAGCGTQNEALSFGGAAGPSSAVTEKFNGSTWTNSGDLNTSRTYLAGCGLQGAALSFGGQDIVVYATTEKFNGSTWTYNAAWNLNTARAYLAGAGIQNASLSFGGTTGSVSAVTEKFDGSTWTTSGNLNTARYSLAGAGIQSAGLSFGGYTSSNSAITEKFNGTNWSNSGTLTITRRYLAGCGIQSDALSFGGISESLSTETTEKFNGTTWVVSENLNTGRYTLAGSGTKVAGLSFGGDTGSVSAVTEKFDTTHIDFRKLIVGKLDTYYNTTSQYIDNIQSTNIQTENIYVNTVLTTSTGNLAYVNSDLVDSAHLSTDNLLYNNSDYLIPSEKAIKEYTQEYVPTQIVYGRSIHTDDYTNFAVGDIWSTNSNWNLNTARRALAGCGTQSSALSFGGTITGTDYVAITEKFDGNSWSITGNLNTDRWGIAGCGSQNSALSFGGYTSSVSDATEKFDGNSWSITGNLNTARRTLAGAGIQSAALSFGGATAGPTDSAITEKFDGSTWTNANSLNKAKRNTSGCGIQSAALNMGGDNATGWGAVTEKFNGSVWSESFSMTVARNVATGCGIQSAALAIGGVSGSGYYLSTTEKFNGTLWSISGNLSTARWASSGVGSQDSAMSSGGGIDATTVIATTEKLTVSTTPIILTVTNTNPTLVLDNWSVTGSCNTIVIYTAGGGVQNAAIKFGGYGLTGVTEKFNNTTWTQLSATLNTPRFHLVGCGTQNASLSFGGMTVYGSAASSLATTEKFNGYTWTTNASWNLVTARTYHAGCGTQNSALACGGTNTAGTTIATAELFNGVTWVATGSLNLARFQLSGTGHSRAALAFGGWTTLAIHMAEKFNGSVWTITGYMVASSNQSARGAGTQNATVTCRLLSGKPQKFNGSVWMETVDTNASYNSPATAGNQQAALIAASSNTEKFIGTINFNSIVKVTSEPGVSPSTEITNTVTDASSQMIVNTPATCEVWLDPIIYQDQVEEEQLTYLGLDYPLNIAWTATGSLNTARAYLAGCGTQNAALSFGGWEGSNNAPVTEKFDGSSWNTATGIPLITARRVLAGCGIQNSALSFGGYISSFSAVTEKFDGSIWSTTGYLNTSRGALAGAGTQSAALSFGGYDDTYTLGTTEKFNGTSWSTSTSWNLNTARRYLSGCGLQNAGLSCGGAFLGGSYFLITELFNGNLWYNSAALNIARYYATTSGLNNSSLLSGGYNSYVVVNSESFNGNYWTVSGYTNTARYGLGGSGSSKSGLNFGGNIAGPTISAVTEKFTYTVSPLLSSGTKFIVDVRN